MRDERLLAGLLLWIAMGGVAPAQEPGYLDLGDVTAGGDGLGTADPSNVGIHPDTGALVTERFRSFFSNEGANPQPVDGSGTAHDSPFIDVVFVIHSDQMEINSAGVVFDFDDGDDNRRAWGAILKGWDTNGPDYLEFGHDVVFEDGVAVHSPEGITYDLDALRAAHGNDMVRFVSAVAGENSSPAGPGSVNTYMILSSESEVLAVARFPGASNFGRFQELEIPEAARFLTLAVGAANSDVLHDHGAFGRARITSVPTVTAIDHLRVRGGAVVLEPGETKQLEVQAFLGGELAGVLAATFHPELSGDNRIHARFLSLGPRPPQSTASTFAPGDPGLRHHEGPLFQRPSSRCAPATSSIASSVRGSSSLPIRDRMRSACGAS